MAPYADAYSDYDLKNLFTSATASSVCSASFLARGGKSLDFVVSVTAHRRRLAQKLDDGIGPFVVFQ
jgi:hypothetical protein